MIHSDTGLFPGHERSNWIRLRTIILLRWVAIAGQLIAIVVAQQVYSLRLEYGLCYMVVGLSAIGNLFATFVFPKNKRLSETENFLMALFDLLQLGFLLYLTGGLHNPFAVLLLAPVAVSAAVLALRSTIVLAGVAILIATVLTKFHLPLQTQQGVYLHIPEVFVFGNWVAITITIIFLSIYSRSVTSEMHSMSDALAATQLVMAREQKLADLGGVVAATAHELGTPLATIKLASAELMEELSDNAELHEDAVLIHQQADRCRDIMRDMGRAGKDDLHMRQAPLSTVILEAADPHMNRGKSVHFEGRPGQDGGIDQPSILRHPEVIHGLRNLIQNAVDFATANIWIESGWSDDTISIRILDDGPGFSPALIGRIGEPFVRNRRGEKAGKPRPEYEGMGLGLFIAKTLLQRTGAELSFANGPDPHRAGDVGKGARGAIVQVVWPRDKIDARAPENIDLLMGKNRPFQA